VVHERDPVMLKLSNAWITLNSGGPLTDDKPIVTLTTPQDPHTTSAFLNVRVAGIGVLWRARSTPSTDRFAQLAGGLRPMMLGQPALN